MTWALGFLALLHYFLGVSSQAALTQPASVSVSPGETAKLSCTKSSGGDWSRYFNWYQQKEGQAPRFVIEGCNSCSTTRGDGIPDRFTVSSSGNVGSLTINNLQPEDEANYYCAVWEGTGIHSQPTLTQPASQSVPLAETVKLSCSRCSGGSWGSFGWYQQTAGQGPRFLWSGSSTRGDGVPDRFTGSSSGTNGYLTIANAQPDDEADYYCADWENTGGSKSHSGTN
ncbi:hypothetical protein lerEdw1_003688 [Lerista edwardsae]|nr:hypothetical protein lerEdw1_003688 [Lerista edwardsae]